MKSFTNEEIIESLKDNLLSGTITSCLFMNDIEQIKSDLENRKRLELAGQIKSKLLPKTIEDLTKKDIFDTDGGLTNLGLAHVALFIKTMDKVNAPPAATSDEKESDNEDKNNADEIKAMVTAIKKAKPEKVVYLSSVGAHLENGTGAIRKNYDMEQALRRLDIPTAGIRAAWFMENFKGSIPYAKESGKLPSFLNPLDLSIPMVSTNDIGKLAATLLEENWEGHRILELAGPCSYSAKDVAYVLSYELERPVCAEAIPAQMYAASYESFGFTEAASQMMAEMNDGFNRGYIVFEKAGQEQVTADTLLEDAIKSCVQA